MLILSRQDGEEITIGDDVRVRVLDIKGNRVVLGITAPREIEVHRREVYDLIRLLASEKQEGVSVEFGDGDGL